MIFIPFPEVIMYLVLTTENIITENDQTIVNAAGWYVAGFLNLEKNCLLKPDIHKAVISKTIELITNEIISRLVISSESISMYIFKSFRLLQVSNM